MSHTIRESRTQLGGSCPPHRSASGTSRRTVCCCVHYLRWPLRPYRGQEQAAQAPPAQASRHMSQPGSRRAADQEDTSQTLLDPEAGTAAQGKVPTLSGGASAVPARLYEHLGCPRAVRTCHRVAAYQQPDSRCATGPCCRDGLQSSSRVRGSTWKPCHQDSSQPRWTADRQELCRHGGWLLQACLAQLICPAQRAFVRLQVIHSSKVWI